MGGEGKSDLVRCVFRLNHHDWYHRAMQSYGQASSTQCRLASSCGPLPGCSGDGTLNIILPLSLGWLGLPSCYFSGSVVQPSFTNLRFGPSTLTDTTVLCTETSPINTQLIRFFPPTQNSTQAPSPFLRVPDFTLVRKPGK